MSNLDKEYEVSVRAIFVVPECIICALVKVETESTPPLLQDNEFQHITLYTKAWKPVESNNVLKGVMGEHRSYQWLFEELIEKEGGYSEITGENPMICKN